MAADYPDVVARLQQEMDAQARTIWSTSHAEDPTCLPFAKKYYGGFYGPWLELPPSAMVEEA